MIEAGIIGGGGYTAGELIRLLLRHPGARIKFVQSGSQAGRPVSGTHTDLVGDTELVFQAEASAADVLFLCMGHGKSSGWMAENRPDPTTLVVDLSSDFRLDDDWVYGLPELNRAALRGARRIANPGCFATAIQLALLPLASAGLLTRPVHVHAITGSTGAGRAPGETTHFSRRAGNVSIYKAFEHQHLAEIGRSLRQAGGGKEPILHFLPVRGNFTRGIFASAYTATALPEGELVSLYKEYYREAAYTHFSPENPELKQVVNTNKALVHVARHGEQALAISIIDNLLKGASGQAVQIMNLALGLPERAGLELKAGAF